MVDGAKAETEAAAPIVNKCMCGQCAIARRCHQICANKAFGTEFLGFTKSAYHQQGVSVR
ncbi:hypothetical protein HaLaN_04900 [Haematococcus lacustris]|uniref:Uncharacterized protein n=1 Tax=Haematococcus lacustris TaxID=44745 RepID=A0A699YTK0_HAELA|nr:hypothetical protein HaLaN_04900 [Haematococcus lacustris]